MHHTLSSWITQNNYVYCLIFKLLTFKYFLEYIIDINRIITVDYNEEETILIACHQHRMQSLYAVIHALSIQEKRK